VLVRLRASAVRQCGCVIDRPSAPRYRRPKVPLLPMRPLPTGFVPPALPTRAKEPPRGSDWWHEIKHDGIRVIARNTDRSIKLYSRPGNDLTRRFPLIAEGLERLRARSCILDGEAVACGEDGIALFELVRHWRNGEAAFLFAFDVIELNGDDLRAQPLQRCARTASGHAAAPPSNVMNSRRFTR
jgi:bifunctional non-homologous end joining protein LigD